MEKKTYSCVSRTKHSFETALAELSKTTPLPKITVKALCEQAQLSRNAFYFHYADIDALIEDIENNMYAAITDLLEEVKESIINAYELKTGQSRTVISHMMDDETWFNAKKAVELGFADDILYTDGEGKQEAPAAVLFSKIMVMNSFLCKFNKPEPEPDTRVSVEPLKKRLFLLSH